MYRTQVRQTDRNAFTHANVILVNKGSDIISDNRLLKHINVCLVSKYIILKRFVRLRTGI